MIDARAWASVSCFSLIGSEAVPYPDAHYEFPRTIDWAVVNSPHWGIRLFASSKSMRLDRWTLRRESARWSHPVPDSGVSFPAIQLNVRTNKYIMVNTGKCDRVYTVTNLTRAPARRGSGAVSGRSLARSNEIFMVGTEPTRGPAAHSASTDAADWRLCRSVPGRGILGRPLADSAMNPLGDYEPTPRECRRVARCGRLGLLWICVRSALRRWWHS